MRLNMLSTSHACVYTHTRAHIHTYAKLRERQREKVNDSTGPRVGQRIILGVCEEALFTEVSGKKAKIAKDMARFEVR